MTAPDKQMTTQSDDDPKRAPMPEITEFPSPVDQQLVDAILRDPMTPAGVHVQQIMPGQYKRLNSAASRATRILQKPVVQRYMRVQQERIRRAADIEQSDLLAHLAMIIKTDITQVATWDEQGRVTFAETDQLPTHTRRAIKKIKTKTTTRHFERGGSEETVTTELEMYSHLDAIKLFSEIAGIKGTDGSVHIDNHGVIYLNPPQSPEDALKGKTIHEG